MSGIGVSAVIPAYNDRSALEHAIPASIEALARLGLLFELIIAEDGSSDGSDGLVREWELRDPRVRLLHSDQRLGRGRALKNAFSQAHGSIVLYYDVDLATDLRHLPDLVNAVRNGCSIATGSRLLPGSDIIRTGWREIASRGYNFLVRVMLGSRVHDHQCGFKAFDRERLLAILPLIRDTHWFWDTEVLVRGARAGYRICELPVTWRSGRGTTVRRTDIITMGWAVISLWWHIHVVRD